MPTKSLKKAVLVIHGPNLNMLGFREPEVYGKKTLSEINDGLAAYGAERSIDIETFQSNHEGRIVDRIQQLAKSKSHNGLIINPAAYTHTSIAIRDALLLLDIPIVEIHLSNIHKRESFRHKSMMADIVTAQITGFGDRGYFLALDGILQIITEQ